MNTYRRLQKAIYRALKPVRWKVVREFVDPSGRSLLDIGAEDHFFHDQLKERYEITLADIDPRDAAVRRENVEHLSFDDDAFDIVLCLQVLEHTLDPVRAMLELKRVARKQLVISVPYEPFFTFLRFGHWEPEHRWAIRPEVFRHHLGPPDKEALLFFRRYYLASWKQLG